MRKCTIIFVVFMGFFLSVSACQKMQAKIICSKILKKEYKKSLLFLGPNSLYTLENGKSFRSGPTTAFVGDVYCYKEKA